MSTTSIVLQVTKVAQLAERVVELFTDLVVHKYGQMPELTREFASRELDRLIALGFDGHHQDPSFPLEIVIAMLQTHGLQAVTIDKTALPIGNAIMQLRTRYNLELRPAAMLYGLAKAIEFGQPPQK